MATKLYLRNVPPIDGDPGDAERSSALPDGGVLSDADAPPKALSRSKGSVQTQLVAVSVAAAPHTDYFFTSFSSPRLAAQTITAQNWTIALAGDEDTASFVPAFRAVLYVYRPSTSSVVGFIIDNQAVSTEFEASGIEGRVATVAGSAVTAQDGDILVFEPWVHANYGGTTFGSATLAFDGASEPVDQLLTSSAASYVQSTNDLLFLIDVVTEDFSGASGMLPNPPWTQQTSGSNVVRGSGLGSIDFVGDAAAFWNQDAFTDNQYAQAILAGDIFGQETLLVTVRSSGTGASTKYYAARGGASGVQIMHVDGALVGLLATDSMALAAGDVLRIEAEGTTLRLKVNGVTRCTASDATLTSGRAGIGGELDPVFATAVTFDNWEAGELLPVLPAPENVAAPLGVFDPELVAVARFAPSLEEVGRFDEALVDEPASTPVANAQATAHEAAGYLSSTEAIPDEAAGYVVASRMTAWEADGTAVPPASPPPTRGARLSTAASVVAAVARPRTRVVVAASVSTYRPVVLPRSTAVRVMSPMTLTATTIVAPARTARVLSPSSACATLVAPRTRVIVAAPAPTYRPARARSTIAHILSPATLTD